MCSLQKMWQWILVSQSCKEFLQPFFCQFNNHPFLSSTICSLYLNTHIPLQLLSQGRILKWWTMDKWKEELWWRWIVYNLPKEAFKMKASVAREARVENSKFFLLRLRSQWIKLIFSISQNSTPEPIILYSSVPSLQRNIVMHFVLMD